MANLIAIQTVLILYISIHFLHTKTAPFAVVVFVFVIIIIVNCVKFARANVYVHVHVYNAVSQLLYTCFRVAQEIKKRSFKFAACHYFYPT